MTRSVSTKPGAQAALSALGKVGKTSRGMPRVRARKGFWDNLRFRILSQLPSDELEEWLDRRLRRLSVNRRHAFMVQIRGLSDDARREAVARYLSRR